ncbi:MULTISPECIES: hypothetical protein [unclassified Variovorax]|uniref:hypothetical protein n=1 Tax=unclassified Variovorax TaxID=663243 RepID=UPI0008388E2B|nr:MULTISPECIES: hypothetical protein [unclassified Variovorax]PNG50189.1 hypothetical protein CHC06_05812 [Variovorax sp. B2]PNG51062.1 hypothetical protein CHC07_05718 [Variovorax sp. B4]VTV17242.1 hypothetical protein WDL1P1_00228 [Variovorax sp. WDL1]
MGGNALNGIRHTRRFSAAEYHPLVSDVLGRVQTIVGPNRRAAVIPAYRAKESFGDMDVLVEVTDGSAFDFRHSLARAFGIDYLVSDGSPVNQLDAPVEAEVAVRTVAQLAASGKTYSFAFNELQVDILPTSPLAFDTSLSYYGYNDCGNLLGRVVHSFGMKLGHLGLLYPFKSGTHEFTELLVERDWRTILPAFGWQYETWAAGFDTLEDIFRFVASTPFFNPDIFQLHNRNAKSRVRDRKRTSYKGFLAWLEEQPAGSLPAYPYEAAKDKYLPMLMERLEGCGFRERYAATAAEFRNWNEARARFCGEVVRDWSGLDGRDLAGLMTDVRTAMGSNPAEVQAYVLSHSDAQLKELVTQWSRQRLNAAV